MKEYRFVIEVNKNRTVADVLPAQQFVLKMQSL